MASENLNRPVSIRGLVALWAFALLLFFMAVPPVHASQGIELYGTFQAMGVIVTFNTSDDPNGNAVCNVAYRVNRVGASYREGFPLSRVASTRFVGSLFWLRPGVRYDVKVTLTDPDGDPLDGVTLKASASTRAEITIPAPTRTHTVSPGGTGTKCTESAPCSLAQGLNQAQAGEAVVLRGGIYYEGEFSPPQSGTQGAPIVIQSYPGEKAILDGGDPESLVWTSQGNGIYSTTVHTADPHLVLASGKRLYPHQSLSDLQNNIWKIPGFYRSGTTVYVRLARNANPNTVAMVVSRYNNAFTVDGQNNLVFLNLVFRHYGQGSYAKAIYFNDASDNVVRKCTFAVNDTGIGIKRDSHRNVIEHNEFYDTVFRWPWDGVKAGSGLESGGVLFYDPTTGRGNVIRHNTFHDYFDGLGACPSDTSGITNETDIYGNLVYRTGDDGMETDGQCSNVRIWGNTFHDVLMGISLAPVYTGPVYAIRNLIYRTGVGNNNFSGSPFKFNSSYDTSGPMYLFHNTCDAALPGNNGLYIKEPGAWDMIYARNNIWAGTDYAIYDYNTHQPLDLDHDDLWTSSGGDLARWDNTRYATLTDLIAGTGQESHGLNEPPGFINSGENPYELAPSSALIDAGVFIPGINDNYRGAAPDMGAFESKEPPTVTVTAADPSASESGKNWGRFQITRTGATTTELLVRYTILGSASNGVDYKWIQRRTLIKVGNSSKVIMVQPIDDTDIEGRESVKLILRNSTDGSYVTGDPSRATVRILDNDS